MFILFSIILKNNPVSDMEKIIINNLRNLYEQSLIKYLSFKFKVIYALPYISFNNYEKVDKN